jgi:glycosyltransferase involved in cell wall biosynthesis
MRVAYFTESLPPLSDGVTRTLERLVETLTDRQVEFMFFSAVDPDGTLPWRARVHRVTAIPFPLYRYYRMGIPWPGALDGPLDRFRPDLIHIVNPTLLGNYGISYAERRGLPVVGSFHTHFVSYLAFYGFAGLEPYGWKYLAWFYNRCAVTYVPSRATTAELRRNGIERLELWRRGVDLQQFAPHFRSPALRERLGAAALPILLFVGRLVREKNLDDLAAAVQVLRERNHRFQLVLVGDGPMRAELEARLPWAHFAGHQEGADLARWYASADLFVFPSTTETFGNVTLEAFASGLPVVAANCGGARDLVVPGVTGLLARPADPVSFADRVELLLQNPGHRIRMGLRALEWARHFRWPEVNERLLQSYARVVARHGPGEQAQCAG